MTISDYRKFFASINSYPKKSLGQNYLIDKNILHKIGEIAELNSDDLVIEVGTGFGFLTSFLAERVKKVISVEKDKAVFEHMLPKFATYKNAQLINKDALKVDFKEIVGQDTFKFISNLPYSVASQIIFSLLKCYGSFTSLVIMVQKEMGERICSAPDSKQYGAFSVVVQSYFDTEIKNTVSPNSFWPKPEVDSVIIKMTPRKEKIVNDSDRMLFNEIVKKSFQTRRKKLINNLKSILDQKALLKIFEELKLNPNIRAEQLSLDNYVTLTTAIKTNLV
ncbi:MAG: ribosomal RNA small subunit methyltransferase A [Candidatus Dadabacteria bacterium]|nr:ribosomal RNA small subunit methyltransferase A [Candidatus Dadabacteria bacterium]NIS07305.1 ribosomal RNA small subunit methyltransferase A [Candidatus Dadabacteria bacterium]NIY20943.1 ribosomal RNA small subunit methyltransferase A [Candidatus Dadabacteria bacterium]